MTQRPTLLCNLSASLVILVIFLGLTSALPPTILSSNDVCNCKSNLVPFFKVVPGPLDYAQAFIAADDNTLLCGHKGRLGALRSLEEHDCVFQSIIIPPTMNILNWFGGRQPVDQEPYVWHCDGACDFDGVPFFDEATKSSMQKYYPFSFPEPNNDAGDFEECISIYTNVPGPNKMNDGKCSQPGAYVVSYFVYSEFIDTFSTDVSFLKNVWDSTSTEWNALNVTADAAIIRNSGASESTYFKSLTPVRDRFMSFDVKYLGASAATSSQLLGFTLGSVTLGTTQNVLFRLSRTGNVFIYFRTGTTITVSPVLSFPSSFSNILGGTTYRLFVEAKSSSLRVWISQKGSGDDDDFTSFQLLAGFSLSGTTITSCEPFGASCTNPPFSMPLHDEFGFYTEGLTNIQFSTLNEFPFASCGGMLSFSLPYSFCPSPSSHTVLFDAPSLGISDNTEATLNANGEATYSFSSASVNAVTGVHKATFTITAPGSYNVNGDCQNSGSTPLRTTTRTFFILITGGAPNCIPSSLGLSLDNTGVVRPSAYSFTTGPNACQGLPSISPSVFSCSDILASPVNVNVFYSGGASCVAQANIIDNIGPTASCVPSVTVSLDSNGLATITDPDVVSASDACGLSLISHRSSFSCADVPLSPISVLVTVKDSSANTATCTSQVTVQDVINPVASCQPTFFTTLSSSSVSITIPDIDSGSSDNCGIVVYQISPSSFSFPGTFMVTLTVIDGSGNQDQCMSSVTVLAGLTPTPSLSALPSLTSLSSSTPSQSGVVSPTPSMSSFPSTTPSPSPSPSQSQTVTSSFSTSPSSSGSITGSLSLSRTSSNTLSASPSITTSPSPSRSNTASPSGTKSPTPSTTTSRSPTATSSASKSGTPTISNSKTPSKTLSASKSLSSSSSPSTTSSQTPTPTRTGTRSPTETRSSSKTNSPTSSVSPSPTRSKQPSATRSTTTSPSPSPTSSRSSSSSQSSTPTFHPPSITQSVSPSHSVSPSSSSSRSPSKTPSETASVSKSLSSSRSALPSPSSSKTPSSSLSPSRSTSPSISESRSPSASRSISPSVTKSPSSSSSPSSTRSPSLKPSPSPSPSLTSSLSPSSSPPPVLSLLQSASPTSDPSLSATRPGAPTLSSLATERSSATASATLSSSPSPQQSPSSPEKTPSSSETPLVSVSRVSLPSSTPSPSFFSSLLLPTQSSSSSPSANSDTIKNPSSSPSSPPAISFNPLPTGVRIIDLSQGGFSLPVPLQDPDGNETIGSISISLKDNKSPNQLVIQKPDQNAIQSVDDKDLRSPIINVDFVSGAGPFKATLCLTSSIKKSDSLDDFCLAFYDEKKDKWLCEDCSLKHHNSLTSERSEVCGTTDHFTNFAILLGGAGDGGSRCGRTQYITGTWKGDAILTGSVLGLAIFVVACCILVRCIYQFTKLENFDPEVSINAD